MSADQDRQMEMQLEFALPGLLSPVSEGPVSETLPTPASTDHTTLRSSAEERVSAAQADLGGLLTESVSGEEDVLEGVVELFRQSRHFKQLSRHKASDRQVREAGGIRQCKKQSHEILLGARALFFEIRGAPAKLTVDQTTEERDAYYDTVMAWNTYRTNTLETLDL